MARAKLASVKTIAKNLHVVRYKNSDNYLFIWNDNKGVYLGSPPIDSYYYNPNYRGMAFCLDPDKSSLKGYDFVKCNNPDAYTWLGWSVDNDRPNFDYCYIIEKDKGLCSIIPLQPDFKLSAREKDWIKKHESYLAKNDVQGFLDEATKTTEFSRVFPQLVRFVNLFYKSGVNVFDYGVDI